MLKVLLAAHSVLQRMVWHFIGDPIDRELRQLLARGRAEEIARRTAAADADTLHTTDNED